MNTPDTSANQSPEDDTPISPPAPLNPLQRRILGVLIEKARTTPDAYPLSLNALVTGCNQKSNRNPLMSLSPEQVEDELIAMRESGVVAEVHGGGRVAKYRHYGYDYLGVKGVEAGVMTELLLRGEQTAGELRTRAGRFEVIADLPTLHSMLTSLIERNLVVALTPPGRGQLFTHNLYPASEMDAIRAAASSRAETSSPADSQRPTSRTSPASPIVGSVSSEEFSALKEEVGELRSLVEHLTDRLDRLES